MPSARESRAALQLVTSDAVATGRDLLTRSRGTAEARRLLLLDNVPALIGYYSSGSSALAADLYEEERDLSSPRRAFVPELVVDDRTEKVRRAVAWSTSPLIDAADDEARAAAEVLALSRLGEVIQLETARPYRSTILRNRQQDEECVGWRRVTSGGCRLCRMLSDRGAVYKESTARFATHEHCNCTAQPVFQGGDVGEEASAMQYVASKKNRTPAQQADLRNYLTEFYGP